MRTRAAAAGHIVLITIMGLWVAAVTAILPVAAYIGGTERGDQFGVDDVLLTVVVLAGPAILIIIGSARALRRVRREGRALRGFDVVRPGVGPGGQEPAGRT